MYAAKRPRLCSSRHQALASGLDSLVWYFDWKYLPLCKPVVYQTTALLESHLVVFRELSRPTWESDFARVARATSPSDLRKSSHSDHTSLLRLDTVTQQCRLKSKSKKPKSPKSKCQRSKSHDRSTLKSSGSECWCSQKMNLALTWSEFARPIRLLHKCTYAWLIWIATDKTAVSLPCTA